MSKFLEILKSEGYDEDEENPLKKLQSPLRTNIREILAAIMDDILTKYSSVYNDYIDNGVKFDFEDCIHLPPEGLSFNLHDHIEWHLEDME